MFVKRDSDRSFDSTMDRRRSQFGDDFNRNRYPMDYPMQGPPNSYFDNGYKGDNFGELSTHREDFNPELSDERRGSDDYVVGLFNDF